MGNTSDCIIIQTAAKRHRFTRAWQTAAVDASEGFRTALIAMMPHPEAQPQSAFTRISLRDDTASRRIGRSVFEADAASAAGCSVISLARPRNLR